MKQVELIIEKGFDSSLLIDHKTNILHREDYYLHVDFKELWEVLNKYIDFDSLDNYQKLKQGETRETIIEALWEHQKKLHRKNQKVPNENLNKYYKDFHDTETRIITITDFGGNNDNR